MQANCPQCAHKIVIDDAKVPDRAFSVKCPKCQTVVKFPGKAAQAAAAIPPPPEPPPMPSFAEPTSTSPSEELRAQMMAQVRREMSLGDSAKGSAGRALVALPDRGQAGAITLTLTRQGFEVDTIDDWEEGARLLDQGVFSVAVTTRIGTTGKGESLYQRTCRLSPESRRRIFLMLVGDEFKTGDGTQAWACLADLVVSSRDTAAADVVIRNTVAERGRLYQIYLDARRRHDASAG